MLDIQLTTSSSLVSGHLSQMTKLKVKYEIDTVHLKKTFYFKHIAQYLVTYPICHFICLQSN